MAQPDGFAGLPFKVIRALRPEIGPGQKFEVISGKGPRLPVPDADGAVAFVQLGRQALILGPLEEKPGLRRIIVRTDGSKIPAMPVEVILQ